MKRIMLVLIILLMIPLASAVTPPKLFFGDVYEDYTYLKTNKNVSVWGDCFGNGVELLDWQMTQYNIGFYEINITMDDGSTTEPGEDEGCVNSDIIYFYVDGIEVYSPAPGTLTVGASVPRDLYYVTNLSLVSPTDGIKTTDGTTTFTWDKGTNSDFNYTLVIDDSSNMGSPLQSITGISNLSYTLSGAETLTVDRVYYWQIEAYLNGQPNGTSEIWQFELDTTPPTITTVTPTNNTWQSNPSATLSVTTNEDATCKWDSNSGVAYASKTNTMSGSGTSHSYLLSLSNQGNNSVYIQCQDTSGNIMPVERYLNLRLDSLSPDTTGASVLIDSGAIYSNDTTINVTWSGFADRSCPSCSDNLQYRYSTSNDYNSATTTASTSATISGLSQGIVTVYVWAFDLATNYNGPVSDTITVDSVEPTQNNWVQTPTIMYENHTGNIGISVDIDDAVSGVSSVEMRYKRGDYDGSYTSWTSVSGSGETYSFNIPTPGSDWSNIVDQLVLYEVRADDNVGNRVTSTTRQINVTHENYAPVWSGPLSDTTILLGDSLTLPLVATDLDTTGLTYTASMPELYIYMITSTTANALWTPSASDIGLHSVYFNVSDGQSIVASNTISINVSDYNYFPEFPVINDQSGYEEVAFFLNATASDLNSADILVYTDNLPFANINSNGIISFIPLQDARGEHNVTLSVTDGQEYDYVNFTLNIGYCGDNVCNVQESCGSCPDDCGVCSKTTEKKMAALIQNRNCVNEEFEVKVYELFTRATCDKMGVIINGREVCQNLSDVSVGVYIKNKGEFSNDEDQWNLTGEYVTNNDGVISFIPTKKGKYRLLAKKGGYDDAYVFAEVNNCGFIEEDIDSNQEPNEDLTPLIPPEEPTEPELPPEEEEPAIITAEEGNFMAFVLFYLLIPILVLSMFAAGTYYYHHEKDNNKYLLLMRIWFKKKEIVIKAWVKKYYSKLLGGKK